jgi:hypothetical protein
MSLAELNYSQYKFGSIVNRGNYTYPMQDSLRISYSYMQPTTMQFNENLLFNNSFSWKNFNYIPQTINFFPSSLNYKPQTTPLLFAPNLQTNYSFDCGFDTFTSSAINTATTPFDSSCEHEKITYIYNNSNDKFARNNNNYLKNLAPEMRERTEQLIAYAISKGYDVKITSGKRTPEEQKQLQIKYANQPGRAAKRSSHVAGLGVDLEVFNKDGVKLDEGYNLLGNYAKTEL